MAKTTSPVQENAGDNHVWEIPLEQIRPAPWNPPSRMDPAKVKDLAESIKIEGQQSPALIRPVEAELPVRYEIVWGHRRYAALQLLAGQTFTYKPSMEGNVTIKTFIREISEEQAMISSGIENLQREGFSDIEEAEFFRTCGEQYGESAVKIFSEKLSVSDRYIRKRIEILKLPEAALELWRSGTWHVGHMEQLLRLGDNERASEFLEAIAKGHRKPKELAVWQLKDSIDNLAVPLHSGRFEKTDCKKCRKNTDCQLRLFGGEKEKGAECLDQDCFRQKQQAWLDINWPTCKANKFGTQAAVIGDYNTEVTGPFSGYSSHPTPSEKCNSCPKYATVVNLQGEQRYGHHEKVCLGESSCYAEVKAADIKQQNQNKGKVGPGDPDAPRVPWHGEYFRQQFYQQEIPGLMADLSADDPRRLQVALATLVYSSKPLSEWLCEKFKLEIPELPEWQTYPLSLAQILQVVRVQNALQTELLIAEALVKIALRTDRGYETTFSDRERQALAEFLEIDFAKFQVTEEYLNKKTKGELVRFIVHESGLMEETMFLDLMHQRGYATAEKLAQAKKGALVDLVLQCQVDLHGRLPKEVADRPKLQTTGE